jgi:hypothetical protein
MAVISAVPSNSTGSSPVLASDAKTWDLRRELLVTDEVSFVGPFCGFEEVSWLLFDQSVTIASLNVRTTNATLELRSGSITPSGQFCFPASVRVKSGGRDCYRILFFQYRS